jgi:hypothetical protein
VVFSENGRRDLEGHGPQIYRLILEAPRTMYDYLRTIQ